MIKKTTLVLIALGLALTTFSNVSLGQGDLQYVPTIIAEGTGATISGLMAKGAFAESYTANQAAMAATMAGNAPLAATLHATAVSKHLQGVAFTAATVGVLGSLGFTVSNMFKADEGGGGNPNTPDGPPGPGGPGPPRFEPDPGLDGDGPLDPNSPDGNTDGLNNGTNSGNKSLGNADVALDLLNSNPDSGFGAESLGGRDLASSGTGSGSGASGGDSSSSSGKNGAALLSQGIEKELSSWNPQDLAKLKAGDADLMKDLMASLGMAGDPNGIDFSMFSNLLDGILKGEHEKPLENGVLGSELMNKEFSIFEAIKKTTVVAATEFHPKARIALFQKPTAVVAKNESAASSEASATQSNGPVILSNAPVILSEAKDLPEKNSSNFSIMPRKIMNNGAVHE